MSYEPHFNEYIDDDCDDPDEAHQEPVGCDEPADYDEFLRELDRHLADLISNKEIG